MIKRKCKVCTNIFYVFPSKKDAKLCGLKCAYVYLKRTRKGKHNPNWKDDKVGYSALHQFIKRHKLKPKYCAVCKTGPPYDLANISGKYLRDLSDWHYICRRCHMLRDGRMANIHRKGLHAGKKNPRYRHDIDSKKLGKLYLKLRSLRLVALKFKCSTGLVIKRLKKERIKINAPEVKINVK